MVHNIHNNIFFINLCPILIIYSLSNEILLKGRQTHVYIVSVLRTYYLTNLHLPEPILGC